MVMKSAQGNLSECLTASVCAIGLACFPVSASAAMKLEQMKLLNGAAQLDLTVETLIASCGLPAAILDHDPAAGAKQSIHWRGVGMRLSAQDWDAVYGSVPRKLDKSEGWVNPGQPANRCNSGLTQLQFAAKGHAGVLTVTKRPNDIGYITTYTEPKNLYRAHKVIGAKASLANDLPVAKLISRYGQPDELIKQPGSRESYRYWVLTLRENRPDTLYAVDFKIENGATKTYAISTRGRLCSAAARFASAAVGKGLCSGLIKAGIDRSSVPRSQTHARPDHVDDGASQRHLVCSRTTSGRHVALAGRYRLHQGVQTLIHSRRPGFPVADPRAPPRPLP